MAGSLSSFGKHLFSPAVGFVFILFCIETFTKDYIFVCPCGKPLAIRSIYALVFVACPVILCFLTEGPPRQCCDFLNTCKKSSRDGVLRSSIVGVFWIFVYMSSERFPACFVDELPCCDEPLLKNSAACKIKETESNVQVAAAVFVLIVTVVAGLAACFFRCSWCISKCCKCCKCCKSCNCNCEDDQHSINIPGDENLHSSGSGTENTEVKTTME